MEVYIEKVELKNFQSHEHSVLSFEKGINVLCGTSNHGKSAILRAIRWVITNDPSGTDFITHGKDECSVTMYLSNKYSITRTKSKSGNVNTYEVCFQGERTSKDVLTGFGTGVPLEVREAMQINRPEFNFAHQLEAPFLISETPKVRAERIGNLEELGRIDRALTDTNDDIRAGNKHAKMLDGDIKQNKKEMDALQTQIAKDGKIVQTLTRLQEEILTKQGIVTQIERLLRQWTENEVNMQDCQEVALRAERIIKFFPDTLSGEVESLKQLLGKEIRMNEIEETLAGIESLDRHILFELETLVGTIEQQQQTLVALQKAEQALSICKTEHAEALAKTRSKCASIHTEELEKQIEEFHTLSHIQKQLQTASNAITQSNTDIQESTIRMTALIDEFVEALQTEKQCPLCLQNTEHIHMDVKAIL